MHQAMQCTSPEHLRKHFRKIPSLHVCTCRCAPDHAPVLADIYLGRSSRADFCALLASTGSGQERLVVAVHFCKAAVTVSGGIRWTA